MLQMRLEKSHATRAGQVFSSQVEQNDRTQVCIG
jgi:hypothetical protein